MGGCLSECICFPLLSADSDSSGWSSTRSTILVPTSTEAEPAIIAASTSAAAAAGGTDTVREVWSCSWTEYVCPPVYGWLGSLCVSPCLRHWKEKRSICCCRPTSSPLQRLPPLQLQSIPAARLFVEARPACRSVRPASRPPASLSLCCCCCYQQSQWR